MIMNQHYITKIHIDKIRHLHDITIPLSDTECKHLILTGKNGSGKTSVVEALAAYFARFITLEYYNQDVTADFLNADTVESDTRKGNFLFAYYRAEREYTAQNEKNVEKVDLKDTYAIQEHPGKNFIKYILNLKTVGAMAAVEGKKERAAEIQQWFQNFDHVLQIIFDDPTAHLDFDIETFAFHIVVAGREPFTFDTLSSGYAAVLDIVVDLMMRMEKKAGKHYDLEGVVLIDEIETHLHLSLQRKIMPILTGLFPNIQFIVTTHSPFILNSIDNAVIYDLANHTLVNQPEGLSNVPYDGIVEGYFDSPALSDELKKKYERYKQLAKKTTLTDDDCAEIADLEYYLDEIPDYLGLDFMADYKKLKLELSQKEEV